MKQWGLSLNSEHYPNNSYSDLRLYLHWDTYCWLWHRCEGSFVVLNLSLAEWIETTIPKWKGTTQISCYMRRGELQLVIAQLLITWWGSLQKNKQIYKQTNKQTNPLVWEYYHAKQEQHSEIPAEGFCTDTQIWENSLMHSSIGRKNIRGNSIVIFLPVGDFTSYFPTIRVRQSMTGHLGESCTGFHKIMAIFFSFSNVKWLLTSSWYYLYK